MSSFHPFTAMLFGEGEQFQPLSCLHIQQVFTSAGPRICIGMRLGMLQTKLILAMLIKNFKYEPCERTERLLRIDKIKLVNAPEKSSIWLRIKNAS
jgi:cytochrome P450